MKAKYFLSLLLCVFTLSAYSLNEPSSPFDQSAPAGKPTLCKTEANGQQVCVCLNSNCTLDSEDTNSGYTRGDRDYMLCVNSTCNITTNGWIDCIGSKCTVNSNNAVADCISGSECHTTKGISNASLLCEPGQAGKGSETGENTCVAENKADTIYCQRGQDCNYYPKDHRNVRHTKGIAASITKNFTQEHVTSKQWATEQISRLEGKGSGRAATDVSNFHEFRTGSLIGCEGTYALCAYTDCKKKNLPNGDQVAECSCPVNHGMNYGSIACHQRNGLYEKTKNSQQPMVISDYSAINLVSTDGNHQAASAKLFDPADACHVKGEYQYADCFDIKCAISADGKTANCSCPMTTAKGPGFLMEAKNCEEASAICKNFGGDNSEIVANSAPVAFGSKVVNNALKYYNQNLNKNIICSPNDA